MTAATFVAAAVGCGLGCVARLWIGTWRKPHHVPWPTLVANAAGTALLGGAASLLESGTIGESAEWILGAGVAGGLTTFSTLATEAVLLWRSSRRSAVSYVGATAVVSTASGWAAWLVAAALT